MASEYEHYLEAIGEEGADEETEETRRLSDDSLRPHTQEPLDAPVPGQEAEDDVRDSDSPLEMTEADGETVVRRNSSSLAPITSLPIRPATPSDEEAEAVWEGAGAAVDSKDVAPEGSEQGSDLGLEDSAVDFYPGDAAEWAAAPAPAGEESEETRRGSETARALLASGPGAVAEDESVQGAARAVSDPDRYITAAESFGHRPLIDSLTIHVSYVALRRGWVLVGSVLS